LKIFSLKKEIKKVYQGRKKRNKMENLRAAIEKDLADSIEGEFLIEVELTAPNGETQIYSKNDPDKKLGGQVLYYTRRENPETGEIIVVNEPVISLRISSLNIVPKSGETWYIKMPISPVIGAEKKDFIFTPTRAPQDGFDIGFLKIYPQRIKSTTGQVS
jgi:hypothetical protein